MNPKPKGTVVPVTIKPPPVGHRHYLGERQMVNTLHADYCAHCIRAIKGGFRQVPYSLFKDIYAEVMK